MAEETPEKHLIYVPDNAGGAEHPVWVWEADAVQFASRLRKVAKERRKWAARNKAQAYRLYDADLPNYALAIDVYVDAETAAPAVHVAEYEAPKGIDEERAAHRLEDAIAVIPPAMGVDEARVFVKTRRKDKGGSQYALNREARRESFVFATTEPAYNGQALELEVDLNGYLDTGLFLDHRTVRQLVGRTVAEQAQAGEGASGEGVGAGEVRFLNLFAYTGSATVHAAAAGASRTTTVDLSQTYLDWAARNMAANGFAGIMSTVEEGGRCPLPHTFERGDTLNWLAGAAKVGRSFDVVFVDPPTFSNSKAMGKRTWDVQRDHVALLTAVRAVMAPGAICIFSCNLRSFKPDTAALAKVGIVLEDITAGSIPEDFARNGKIHVCYRFTRED